MRRGSERCRRTPTPSPPISCGTSSYRKMLVSRWRIRRETCRLFGVIRITRAVPINREIVRLVFVGRTSLSHAMARDSTHRSSMTQRNQRFSLPIVSRFHLDSWLISQTATAFSSPRVHGRTPKITRFPIVTPGRIIVVHCSLLNSTMGLAPFFVPECDQVIGILCAISKIA